MKKIILKNNKKVLFVAPLPPPYGGIATWMKQIVDNGLPGWDFKLVNNAMIKRVVGEKTSLNVVLFDVWREMKSLFFLVYYLFSFRPSVVHIACGMGTLGIIRHLFYVRLCQCCHVAVVYHYRGEIKSVLASYKQRKISWIKRRIYKWSRRCLVSIAKNVDYNIVLTPFALKWLAKLGSEKKSVFVPNCLIPPHGLTQQKVAYPRIGGAPLNVVYVGAIVQQKGVLELLKVAEKSPWARFKLAGAKTNWDVAQETSIPKNVEFLGPLNQADIHQLLMNSDVFLFLTYTEGFPMSVTEAMFVGLPIITTKVGALPFMIDQDKGGFLVNKDDVEIIAQKLKLYHEQPFLLAKHGDYNRQKAANLYDYKTVVQCYCELYNKILLTY